MCGKLSSISRLIAMTLRSITPDGLGMCGHLRVVGMERQRDEGLEPAGLVLKLAEPDQVVDPVLGAVDVAVKHGGVGVKAEPVGGPVDVEPAFGRGLGAADLLADFGMEDLGTAAGQAAEPGVDQLLEHLLDRLAARSCRTTRSRRPCTP